MQLQAFTLILGRLRCDVTGALATLGNYPDVCKFNHAAWDASRRSSMIAILEAHGLHRVFACVPVPRVCESKHKRVYSLVTECAFRRLVLCRGAYRYANCRISRRDIGLCYTFLKTRREDAKMRRCAL